MFKIKQNYLDHINGFSLALLVALPVIRVTILPLPGISLVLPILGLMFSALLTLYRDGTKKLKLDVAVYLYFICLLFLYLFISAFWNIYDVNIREDVIKIIFIIVLSVSIALTFNRKSLEYFFNWMIGYAIFTTFTYIYHYLTIGSTRGYGIEAYLTRSLILGVGTVICISKMLFYKNVNKAIYGFLSLFLFFGLSISLGRAALLAAVLIGIVLFIYYYWNNWPKSYSYVEYFKNKSSLIFIVLLFGVVMFAVTQIERTFTRLM